MKDRTFEIALTETEKALTDISIIPRAKYKNSLKDAESLIIHKNDIPILAAVLYTKPDYFLTGNIHFFTDKVKSVINVSTTKDFLSKIK